MDFERKKHFRETEIGNLPTDWSLITLKEACSKIGSGITPRGGANVYSSEGTALIRSQNVLNNIFSSDGLVYLNEDLAEEMENVTVANRDVLLNITGDSVARCCTVPDKVLPARVNQHVSIIRTDGKELDPIFLKYYLTTPKMQKQMLSLAQSGGTRNALTKGMIENFIIPKPDIYEQKAIANIFSILDSRIDLNHRMNRTLESLGQRVFKRWFVDFEFPNQEGKPYKSSGGEMTNSAVGEIPKGWMIGGLGDICEITMGQSPPGESYNETGEGVPFFQGVRDFGFRFPSRRIYCTAPTRFAAVGDVLLSVRAPVGSLNVAKERSAIGRGVAALRLKGKQNGFLYYLLLETRLGWDKYESEGTVFGSATKQGVYDFKIGIPLKNLRDQFGELIEPLDKRILLNELESHNLTLIRDSLLPRLMSGKTRVHNSDNSEEN